MTDKHHSRPEELTKKFLQDVNKHLAEVVAGEVDELFEINKFAEYAYIHPTHLSNTIKQFTGKSPCHFYQDKIMEAAKKLLSGSDKTIKEIALLLTYDPSNFTKVFKRFAGITPKQFRAAILKSSPF